VGDDAVSEQRIEIAVDRDRCMSSAACTGIAPGTFALDGEGISTVQTPVGDDLAAIVEAADSCPVRAIRVRVDGVDQA
jgi:ferredoxin